MALSPELITNVEDVLRYSLRRKFQTYNPEPSKMPFHTRLLGKDRVALFSFIHSLNTNFGTSIFEPVALAISSSSFLSAESSHKAGEHISSEAQKAIQEITDLKTAKPNVGSFKEFKRTLLEWVAVTLAVNPTADVQSLIAIPYNPYEPEPYNRWTMKGMLDLNNELKVADEFWDFLGCADTYKDLLDVFERIGIELRGEIDNYFARYNQQ
ncbi:MAG: TdeIII family type II restriction endonuclease [Nitrospirae bacterium]|nr:TdeIII family type II restriction endonuclease [Nitrospirota bacterium]